MIGCSFDPPEANAAFAKKYNFPFPLIADTKRKIGIAYGAAESPFEPFARRIAYLIGPDGHVVESHPKVSAATYPKEQLGSLKEEA